MMYNINVCGDKFHCHGKVQDGVEHWVEKSLEDAISTMIEFAKVMNGTTISKKNINITVSHTNEVSNYSQTCDALKNGYPVTITQRRPTSSELCIKYNITSKEIKTILQIRSGKLRVVKGESDGYSGHDSKE